MLLVVSIRRDGTPRLSPVEPLLLDRPAAAVDDARLAGARDLLRDPRLLVHGVVTSRDGADGEVKLRGRAVAEDDHGLQRRYADTVTEQLGWTPGPGRFHLCSVDIAQVTYLRYVDGDQWLTDWPPGRESVAPDPDRDQRRRSGAGPRAARRRGAAETS